MNTGSAKLLVLMPCLLGLVFAAPAWATSHVFYSQDPIDAFDAEQPGIGPGTDGVTDGRYLSDPNIGALDQSVERADDFVITTTTTLTDIHWWGSYSTGLHAENFTISIYSALQNVDGSLSTALFHRNFGLTLADITKVLDGTVDYDNPPDPLVVQEQYFYTYILDTPIDLPPGTYFLSIVNNTGPDADWYWSWGEEGNSESWYRLNDDLLGPGEGTENWYPNAEGKDLAFQLTDDSGIGIVPEPASMSLLALGLAGFAMRQYRRRG